MAGLAVFRTLNAIAFAYFLYHYFVVSSSNETLAAAFGFASALGGTYITSPERNNDFQGWVDQSTNSIIQKIAPDVCKRYEVSVEAWEKVDCGFWASTTVESPRGIRFDISAAHDYLKVIENGYRYVAVSVEVYRFAWWRLAHNDPDADRVRFLVSNGFATCKEGAPSLGQYLEERIEMPLKKEAA